MSNPWPLKMGGTHASFELVPNPTVHRTMKIGPWPSAINLDTSYTNAVALAAFGLVLRKYLGLNVFRIDFIGNLVSTIECEIAGGDTLAETFERARATIELVDAQILGVGATIMFGVASQNGRALTDGTRGLDGRDIRLVVDSESMELTIMMTDPLADYDAAFSGRACAHLLRVMTTIMDRPNLRVRELDVLSEDERKQILEEFNSSSSSYPRKATIQGLFHEQVEIGSDLIALTAPDGSLTYGELDLYARQVATRLRGVGVSQGDRVAVLAGKVSGQIVAILGILMAGAVYVPIDPTYPLARRDLLMRDSGTRVVLTTGESEVPPPAGMIIIKVEDCRTEVPNLSFEVPISATDPAYVMYTSGTTGIPKGVVISHRSVIRLVRGTNYVSLTSATRMLQVGAMGFDAATFEIWGALLNGGTLILVPSHVALDCVALGEAIEVYAATTMFVTTPLFHQLVDQDASIFTSLLEIVVGGDVLSPRHVDKVRSICPELRVINGYGPTENTTFSTAFTVDRSFTGRIPIGRPISNSSAYVIDIDGKLQPIGVPGDLLVGGDGVSLGYLGLSDLSSQSFVTDAFGSGDRLYRTGDRAQWLSDGSLDFLGRLDDQIKIRGFRVEPMEVEKSIAKLPNIRSVVVLAHLEPGGQPILSAFFTADRHLASRDLKALLRTIVPEYMIPAHFIQLQMMPYTAHGKIDRAALSRREHAVGIGS